MRRRRKKIYFEQVKCNKMLTTLDKISLQPRIMGTVMALIHNEKRFTFDKGPLQNKEKTYYVQIPDIAMGVSNQDLY